MKKGLFTIGVILVFLIGLGVLLYPYIADYFNSVRQSRVVAQYYRDVRTLTEEDFSGLFTAAQKYNESLLNKTNRFVLSNEERTEYLSLLNPFGNSVIGTLVIDSINVQLPIYHGTGEEVLQIGAGHLEGSSLPVGGPGTHTVITGHRGLPSSTLLTELDKLKHGDTFALHVMNAVLTYEVDQILTVEPHEMDALSIQIGMDYCTLVTCTPYGINSHRMLVRGFRVANAALDVPEQESFTVPGEAGEVNNMLVAAMLISPVFICVVIILTIKIIKLRKK